MIRRPPRSTRTDTLVPYTTLFRSNACEPAPFIVSFHADGPPKLFGPLETCRPVSIDPEGDVLRSEEHTSELQSLMRISYAVFCLKKTRVNNQEQMARRPDVISTFTDGYTRCAHQL